VRENRMLRSTWRGLETWFGRKLINTGAPVPDPTDERGRETGCASTRSPRPSSTLPQPPRLADFIRVLISGAIPQCVFSLGRSGL